MWYNKQEAVAKGCLAQSVRLLGGTPQVLSSTPRGSEFQAGGKKNPLACPHKPKRRTAQPGSHRATDSAASGWGRGFGSFLDLCEKIILLLIKCLGASYPLPVEFFFFKVPFQQ